MFDSRTALRLMSSTHEFWYRLTGGLIGANVLGAPILLLTTTGRRTGTPHTMPLLFLRDGDDLIVIASNGGSDRHPAWWLNLRAEPHAAVQVWNTTRPVRAQLAHGETRLALWERIVRRYPVYTSYQRRTQREIPVVILQPA